MKKQFKAGGDSKSWGLVFSEGPQSHHSLKADISGSPGRPQVTGSDPAGGQSFAKQQRPGRGGGGLLKIHPRMWPLLRTRPGYLCMA